MTDKSLEQKKTRAKEIFAEINRLEKRNAFLRTEEGKKEKLKSSTEVAELFFSKYPDMKQYLDDCSESIQRDLHVMDSSGRCRWMWRILTGQSSVIAAAKRRAMNSPIQGISSAYNTVSSSIQLREMDKYVRKFKVNKFFQLLRLVHDAIYFKTPYELLLPNAHIAASVFATKTAELYKETFDMDFKVDPELELQISAEESHLYTWDWSFPSLADCIFCALVDHIKIGRLKPDNFIEAVKRTVEPYTNLEKRKYLMENYAIQYIHELDDQVEEFLSTMRKHVKYYKENVDLENLDKSLTAIVDHVQGDADRRLKEADAKHAAASK